MDVSRWRKLVAALGAIAAVALAIGIILGTGLPGSSSGASPPAKSSGATTVQRRDLIATDTQSGTLSYATPQAVFNRMSGTVTWLPTIGQVVKPGQTLYKVDGAPVVLFNGTVPAYRDLSEGVSDGLDVQELKQNLVALGFDPSHQITINQTFDSATTAAVDRWQSALGESQTGTVTLGKAVFLPGPARITAVDTKLGSTGGSSGSGSGSGSSGSSGSGSGSGSSGTGASLTVAPPRPEFVSLTTTTTPTATTTAATPTPTCPVSANRTSTAPVNCPTPKPSGKGKPGAKAPTSLAALLALLQAETLELKKSGSSPSSSGAGGRSAGGGTSSAGASGRSGGGGGGGSGAASSGAGASGGGGGSGGSGASGGSGSSGSSGSSGGSGSSGSSGSGSAQEILQTTSTQLVVTVNLDATKQTEAVVGAPVTVQLPDGSTSDGKITQVSPVAQSSSSSSSGSSSSGTGGSGSSTPSATVPVTITLTGHRPATGLDQAAVSVNFQQQKATGVLSVPVAALLATAGGGYAVQEASAPHSLIPVTPGLFAAGYVQISGSQIYPGLQVTDSQG